MADMRKRYEQSLEFLQEEPNRLSILSLKQFMIAICLTQLGRYADAKHLYDLALQSLLADRFWYDTSEPNWLIDIYVSADRPDLYPQVIEEIEAYKLDLRGASLVALYAYAMVCLLSEQDEKAGEYVPDLLERPKVKDTHAMGKTIQAIIDQNQASFDTALDELLLAHRGQAKFGGLRETPEGYLCLPAMSQSKLAWERGLKVNAESEYLSKGYLEYLMAG